MPPAQCPHCQAILTDEKSRTETCPVCSRSLTSQTPPAPQAAPAPRGLSPARLIIASVLALLVVAALVAGLVRLNGDLDRSSLRLKPQPKPENILQVPKPEPEKDGSKAERLPPPHEAPTGPEGH
jgi:hypothetical protein